MTMQDISTAKSCARAEDLVSYLYGEATRDEAKDFEAHAQRCSQCRTELAAFADVRESVGEWRQQALGSFTSTAFEANAVRALSKAAQAGNRKRSALAALREFFTLSPAWMRAASIAAVLVFCSLAVFSLKYFTQRPQTVIAETPVKSGYSEKEVEAMVARALKEQEDARQKESQATVAAGVRSNDSDETNARPRIKPASAGGVQLATNSQKRKQPGSRALKARPSMETASADYLPFTASVDDEKLPSLYDLVDEAN